MVHSLFLFLSMLVLLGWSPEVSAKLYPRDGIPQGDCLERMCASGVCYENDKFEGLCCPKKEDLPKMGETCTECGCLSGECEEGKCGCPNGLKRDSLNRCRCYSYTEQECPSGQYCHFGKETPKAGGVCTDIGDLSLSPGERNILSEAGFSNDVVISDGGMNWWSASSFCIAHEKHLLDLKDFDCYFKGTDTLITGGEKYSKLGDGLCCKKGQNCPRVNFVNSINGGTATSGAEYVTFWNYDGTVVSDAQAELDKYSDKYIALNKIGYSRKKNRDMWTNTFYNDNMVFTIPTYHNGGYVVTWEASKGTGGGIMHALCE